MKNLILILLFASCGLPVIETGPNSENYNRIIELDKAANYANSTFHVVIIDSCEYITYRLTTTQGLITHKGNCKNPIHR